jgi:GH25 family lysozyme M1 (1,4-beta-N-acetylmuramidase)
MSDDLPVMFRAGGGPEETPQPVELLMHPAMTFSAAAPKVLLADVSEFQPDVDDPVYLRWSEAVIFRAMYGRSHVDHAWYGGDRRAQFHQGGARFVGIYQYVVAGQDPIAQAAAMIELVGPLRKGEVIIGDFEEGSGDMATTRRLWASTIGGATGDAPWDYSGLNFAANHGLQPVKWLAAYQNTEPGVRHTLWQFTDNFAIPGVGHADCSVFHGTIDQLAALAHGGTSAGSAGGGGGSPSPKSWQELIMSDTQIPTIGQGATGDPVRTIQGLLIARHHNVTVDGQFGPATKAAVQALQRSKGLADDGVVGPHTWPALLGA